ncbi:unnamed protein product [Ixodes persulcatus]
MVVHLEEKSNSLFKTLSGGIKKRLSLAIARYPTPRCSVYAFLYCSPMIVLGEPSTGMDAGTRRDIWDLFLIMRHKYSIIILTHKMQEAYVLGDKIFIMCKGQVLCRESPAFLKKAFG